ncbi:MAG: ribonuclease T [Geminicoccaceae bacterium]
MPAVRTALAIGLALSAASAAAFEPMQGCFVAQQACDASVSTRRLDNPGDVRLDPGHGYRLLGANKAEATHFQIELPDASPKVRWVEASCGRTLPRCGDEPEPAAAVAAEPPSHADNVLSVGWQPAFCESHRRRPECASQSADRFDAVNFTLHGLWPQPRSLEYCDVDGELERADRGGRWDRLPPVELDPDTEARLEQAMPGTASALERHEWLRHGTCYSRTAGEYFRESLALLDELNASGVRELFASRSGQSLRVEQLRSAVGTTFGRGTGERVEMECEQVGRRTLVTGITLHLRGEIQPGTSLATLLAHGPKARAGCAEGIVDPAGFAR